jgi:SET domain
MAVEVWLILAMAFSLTGYYVYWRGIRNDLVRPNRSSWLIWSAVTTVEALTYQAVNPGLLQNLVFFLSASCCLFVTIAIWRQSTVQPPSKIDWLCIAATIAALFVWLVFQEKLIAHLVMVAAVPISFIPTWVSASQDKSREVSPAWGLWTLADLFTLLIIFSNQQISGSDLPYIVTELICHASIWLLVGLTSLFPFKKNMGTGDIAKLCISSGVAARQQFTLVDGPLGKGVLTLQSFSKGATLMPFVGPRFRACEVVGDKQGLGDRLMQIDRDLYVGPSGGFDDFVNHSCTPNTGLRFYDGSIQLIALRDIEPNEELFWDYSTTLSDTDFFLNCACGTSACRGVIGDFRFLEPELQAHYRELDIVAPHLRSGPQGQDYNHLQLAAE